MGFSEKLCTMFRVRSFSYVKMHHCDRGHVRQRQAVTSSRPSASDLVRSALVLPPCISSPSVWRCSCSWRENLPRLLSRPNKATIIRPFSSCVNSALPTQQSRVRKPLLQSRVLSQVAHQRCWVISVCVCLCP